MKGKPFKVSFWTPEREAELTRLYANTPTAEICQIMKRSTRAIHQRAFQLGLKKPIEPSDKVEMYIHVSPQIKSALMAEAEKNGMALTSMLRAILADRYGLPRDTSIVHKGGKREGSGRKPRAPRHPVISNQFKSRAKPSMPFVPMRST